VEAAPGSSRAAVNQVLFGRHRRSRAFSILAGYWKDGGVAEDRAFCVGGESPGDLGG
jgi:hypothetical protein